MMGYYPSDMMGEWLDESTDILDTEPFDDQSPAFEYERPEELEGDAQRVEEQQWIIEELGYDPAEKIAEIMAYKAAHPDERVCDVYVLRDDGKWFLELEEAFLYIHEREIFDHMMKKAFDAGRNPYIQGYGDEVFDEFIADYTHAAKSC